MGSESGNLARAYDHIRLAVDLDPKAPHAQAVLCWVRLWRKQGEAAIAAGWRAVHLDPNNADAYFFLFFALAVQNVVRKRYTTSSRPCG